MRTIILIILLCLTGCESISKYTTKTVNYKTCNHIFQPVLCADGLVRESCLKCRLMTYKGKPTNEGMYDEDGNAIIRVPLLNK